MNVLCNLSPAVSRATLPEFLPPCDTCISCWTGCSTARGVGSGSRLVLHSQVDKKENENVIYSRTVPFFFSLRVIAQAYGKKLRVLFIMNYCQFQHWAKGKVHVSTAVCTQCRVIASWVISQRHLVFSPTHALYLYFS